MNNPVISVIVPIYNVESYLRKCLDSIIHQTCQHLEIILVEDGSPDKCGEICDEYAANDPRIRVIHQENKGVSAARNAALDIARGDYLMFVDGDDWIEENACESVLSIAQHQHADLVCYGYREIFLSGKNPKSYQGESGEITKKELMSHIVLDSMFVRSYCWNKFVSRRLYETIRFPVGRRFEDFGTVYKLVHLAEKVYVTDAVLYNYVRHDGSLTNSPYLFSYAEARYVFHTEILEHVKEYFPELVDLQLSVMLRDLLELREALKEKPHRRAIAEKIDLVVNTYQSRLKTVIKYSKLVKVFYYCPVLVKPILLIRRRF